jgi:FAD/FMN-containing dehydrogenase/Fe-S oxidoreductase
LIELVRFAHEHKIPVTPRAAGTSLAGQVVGKGLIIDFSKGFNNILEIDAINKRVRVEPGVNRDDLNLHLKPYGLFFGPNTSTSNRCLIGGMVGNNSCGSTSIRYGTTRDHVLEMEVLLSDGSEMLVSDLDARALENKCEVESLEGSIYKQLYEALFDESIATEIRSAYPKSTVTRRNSGYALDRLLNSIPFGGQENFNLSKILCGSEGTLGITTSVTLGLSELPPAQSIVIAAHFETLQETLEAVPVVMEYELYACELMDDVIINCARDHITYGAYGSFIEGNPKAVLLLECRSVSYNDVVKQAAAIVSKLEATGKGYAYPQLENEAADNAWKLRKAGLGLLSNIQGDEVAVACIEDTAVDYHDLPEYISAFTKMMAEFGQEVVYYAHAGAGELHLRPILNLTNDAGKSELRAISTKTARLVKSYGGSLSGEHGDGIVRSEFLAEFYGQRIIQIFGDIKSTWDPHGIFNPGKIVDPWPMDENLRYQTRTVEAITDTIFDFGPGGMLGTVERCNGSGDCRKSHLIGGTMCPSYMATRNEKDTTRARANVLRAVLGRQKATDFSEESLKDVLDLCVSCKGCLSECPSNVDMAALKSEYQYQRRKVEKSGLRDKVFGNFDHYMGMAHVLGPILPAFANAGIGQFLARKILSIPGERSMPQLNKHAFIHWWKRNKTNFELENPKRTVYLFVDEFTNYLDVEIGKKSIILLSQLGCQVRILPNAPSGRSQISKGFLDVARTHANKNIDLFSGKVTSSELLVGIEPSAILTFRDEYPRICSSVLKEQAAQLAQNAFTIEEFLCELANSNAVDPSIFHDESRHIKIHGHCHQKALSEVQKTAFILSIPAGYHTEIIPSGCCGMAGSFGMEKSHFKVSQAIGELVLFPAIRSSRADTIIVASGTSCRHQIVDGTGKTALHPVEVLYDALR